MPNDPPRAVILMGVAGSGKTAVGKAVTTRLNWLFLDADDFHPAANIEKMKHGIPLNDQDRIPWLQALRDELRRLLAEGRSAILACSALKESYRQLLSDDVAAIRFVLLDVDQETIRQRLQHRSAHFFPKELMDSQFAALEKPKDAIIIDARKPLNEVIDRVLEAVSGPLNS
jgi:carbohydrate kinase (thermoresistant glucokinase family)